MDTILHIPTVVYTHKQCEGVLREFMSVVCVLISLLLLQPHLFQVSVEQVGVFVQKPCDAEEHKTTHRESVCG